MTVTAEQNKSCRFQPRPEKCKERRKNSEQPKNKFVKRRAQQSRLRFDLKLGLIKMLMIVERFT